MENDDLFKRLNQLITGGYDVNTGDLIEMFIYGICANSVLSGEILKKQFELEQIIKHGIVLNPDEPAAQTAELLSRVQEKANDMKDSTLADLHLINEKKREEGKRD